MGQEQSLTIRAGFTQAALVSALSEAVADERGVVVSDPSVFEPDPDAYVRPGFEGIGEEEEDDEDGFTRFVGIRTGGERYRWMALHFALDEGEGNEDRWHCDVDTRDLDDQQIEVLVQLALLVGDGDWEM